MVRLESREHHTYPRFSATDSDKALHHYCSSTTGLDSRYRYAALSDSTGDS